MEKLESIFDRIKFATILTTGRTGSDYLQACLDDVEGILTFSDKIFYYDFCKSIKFNKLERFSPSRFLELFINKNNNLLTNNKLENKNPEIDIKKYKENFINICENQKLNRQKFLLAIYLAYHITLGRKIKDIKIMVHHSHHVDETKKFLKDFQYSKLLITIRDPRANLKSGLVNWINYDSEKKSQQHFFYYVKRIREDLKYANKQKNEKFFVKLEEAGDLITKENISKFLGIKYDEKINTATYAGKIWEGDQISQLRSSEGKHIKEVANNGWEDFFTKRDKIILDLIYSDYKLFGYKLKNIKLKQMFCILFLIPTSFLFFKKNNYINSQTKKKTFKYFLIEKYFYLKRIIYLYMVLFNLK